MPFLGIIIWKGVSRFNGGAGGGRGVFQMEGTSFSSGGRGRPMGGIGFDGGVEKNHKIGRVPPPHYGKPCYV